MDTLLRFSAFLLLSILTLALPARSQSGTILLSGSTNADVAIGIPAGNPGTVGCTVSVTHQFKHIKGVEAFSFPSGSYWQWDTTFQDAWQLHETGVTPRWLSASPVWSDNESGYTSIFDGTIDFYGTSGYTLSHTLNTSGSRNIPAANAPNLRLNNTCTFTDYKVLPAGSLYLLAATSYAATITYSYY